MTKKTRQKANVPHMPFVSICTPTYNRRPFIPILFECFRNQKYPKHRIEWIIVDDGTDKIKDLVDQSKIPQIQYYPVNKKMTLGAKRNYMHDHCKGSIIIYMDDDDYYPPERISHAVETLQKNPQALCAGSSEIYLYFKDIKKLYQFGPYNPNHATAATFAFRRELLNISRYDDTACVAEEKKFLKDYTIPFVQLDPLKTILVFSHEHNSFDKRELLKMPNNMIKESNKTIEMFIKNKNEENIKQFFIEDMAKLLENYEPGKPEMKPDVLKQLKDIKEERKIMEEKIQQQQQQILVQAPGQDPVPITIIDAVNIINKQQQQLLEFDTRIKELENINTGLERQNIELVRKNKEIEKQIQKLENPGIKKTVSFTDLSSNTHPNKLIKSKLEPEISIPLYTSNIIVEKQNVESSKLKSKLDPEFKISIND